MKGDQKSKNQGPHETEHKLLKTTQKSLLTRLEGLSENIEEMSKTVNNFQEASHIILVFITIIKKSVYTVWLLFLLLIASFFDEQIYYLVKARLKSVSQTDVMVWITAIALLIAIIQTVIVYRSTKQKAL